MSNSNSQHYTQEQEEYMCTPQPILSGLEGVFITPSLRWLKNPYQSYISVKI